MQDIDLSSNWARKLTERTLDDRVVELERYMHARSRRLPYTWSCAQVVGLTLANNLFLWCLFTLSFWQSFSANPFQGVLDTAELHANRVDVRDEASEDVRVWAEAGGRTATLGLTAADATDADATQATHVLLGASSETASSTLTMAGGAAGENALFVSSHADGAAVCVGASADCGGGARSIPDDPRTLVLDGHLVAVDGSLLVNDSLKVSPGIVLRGDPDGSSGGLRVARLQIGSESAQPVQVSVSGDVNTEGTTLTRELRATNTVQLGAGGAVFVGSRDDELLAYQNGSNVTHVWVRGDMHLLSERTDVGRSNSDTLAVHSHADFQGGVTFTGDVSMGLSNQSTFAIRAKTEVHAPFHVRSNAIVGSEPGHNLTVNGAAAVHGNAYVHGTLAVLSDFSTADIAVTGTIRVGDPMSGTGALGLDVVGGGSFGGDLIAGGSVQLGDPLREGSSVAIRAPVVLESNLSSTAGTVAIARSQLGVVAAEQVTVKRLNLSDSLIISPSADVVWDTADQVTFRNLNVTSDITTNGSLLGFGNFEMRGQTLLAGSVRTLGNVTIGSGAGDSLQVMGTSAFTGNSTFSNIAISGDTTMTGKLSATDGVTLGGAVTVGGGSAGDFVTMHAPATFRSDVVVTSARRRLQDAEAPRAIFTVDGLSNMGALNVSGSADCGALNVHGDVVLGEQSSSLRIDAVTNVSSNLTAMGHTTLEFLRVRQPVTFDNTATLRGTTNFADGVGVNGSVSVGGDVELATDIGSTVAIAGSCQMAANLTVDGGVTIGDHATDVMAVRAASTFEASLSVLGDVSIGSGAASSMAVNSLVTVAQAATFEDAARVDGELSVGGASSFHGAVAVHDFLGAAGGLQVGGDATFKDDANGNLVFIDGHARTIDMHGDLTVTGMILADGGFSFGDAIEVDLINESSDGVGVTIEGVQFIDGGLEFSRADIIEELYEGRGVSVEGVILRDGVLMVESTFPGVDPTGSLDAVTLKNIGCSQNMVNTETAIKFRQMFYHSDGVSHASVQSGNVAIGTETNWSEDPLSQDAYFIVQTTEDGESRDRLRISTERVQVWHDVRVGDLLGKVGPRSVEVHATQGDAVLSLLTDNALARVSLQDPVSTFSVEKDGSVLRLDASADAQGEVHVTPGASGRLRVGNDKLTVSGADGSTTVAGNVEVGNAADAGVPRSLRIFEPSGASLTMTADATSQLVLTSASATDSTKITMGGGAQSFELAQLGSTLSIGANDADGSVEARPGSSGRFAVVSSSAAELVAVDGTSGNTAIAGNVSVGGPGLTGSRVLSVGTGSGDASIDLSSGGGGRAAGLVLTSSSPSGISSDHHIKKTECPDRDGLPRPDCSSLRIDAEDSGSDGEIRLLASEIHADNGHLMVNRLTVRSARAVGFQGQTIDLNSGRVESGASILAPSPGLAAPNDPIPTETISINNERITPTSVVMASVVSQCNDRTGVTVISTDAGIGSVEFTVANFGTRACGGGNINLDERYIINFYLVGDTNARF